jgi:hypothetical protein
MKHVKRFEADFPTPDSGLSVRTGDLPVQGRIILLRAKIFRLLNSNIIKNEKRIESGDARKQISAAGGRK